jgi:hypothetical protein
MALTYFHNPTSNFSITPQGHLKKKALILVEGIHKDSKKRTHHFDEERLELIANNTNSLFENGTRIPILEDHNKTQSSTIGDLNSIVEVRPITDEDLPDGQFQNLIGKLGIFASDILIKSKKAIQQAAEGLLDTISPGIDIMDNCIREISVTPTPAIVGMRLFHRDDEAKFALTWEEAEEKNEQFDKVKESLNSLHSLFLDLVENITVSNEEEREGSTIEDLLFQAISDYSSRIAQTLNISSGSEDTEESGEESEIDENGNLSPQQQSNNIMRKKYPDAGFQKPKYVAAFSMADMAEFGFLNTAQDAFSKLLKKGKDKAYKFGMNNKLIAKQIDTSVPINAFTSPKLKTVLTKRGKLARNIGIGTAATVGTIGAVKALTPEEKKQNLLSRLGF